MERLPVHAELITNGKKIFEITSECSDLASVADSLGKLRQAVNENLTAIIDTTGSKPGFEEIEEDDVSDITSDNDEDSCSEAERENKKIKKSEEGSKNGSEIHVSGKHPKKRK